MFSNVNDHTFFSSPLGDRSTIVDLGANRGGFSSQMSGLFGGTYFLVEANPHLARRLADEGRFAVTHCAVAAREGPISFNIAENDEGSSILTLPEQSAFRCVRRETVTVQARTIKSLVADLGIADIDLLKLDIEGAEVDVLAAIEPELLARIKQITVEFHGAEMFGFDLSQGVEDVIRRLNKLGFASVDFSYPDRRDVLFVNKRYHRISPITLLRLNYRDHLPAWSRRLIGHLPSGLRGALRRRVVDSQLPAAPTPVESPRDPG